jgi:hypothetical protein
MKSQVSEGIGNIDMTSAGFVTCFRQKRGQYFQIRHSVLFSELLLAHACRKRRLKWVLPRLGVGAQG